MCLCFCMCLSSCVSLGVCSLLLLGGVVFVCLFCLFVLCVEFFWLASLHVFACFFVLDVCCGLFCLFVWGGACMCVCF